MPQDLPTSSPTAFGLESFADLLPIRGPIPGSFETFHAAMMASFVLATPYECVIAENLVAIEWELAQHRRMRDAALDEAWERHVEDGDDEEDWEPDRFDRGGAGHVPGPKTAGACVRGGERSRHGPG